MRTSAIFASVLLAVLMAGTATASEGALAVDLIGFKARVQPILVAACISCHGAEKAAGGVSFARLDPDLIAGKDQEHWQNALDALNLGEMPPENAKTPLSPADRQVLVGWITGELAKAREARVSEVAMRRMTKTEYRNTIRDLVGIPYDPTAAISDDPRTHGFDTVGEGLVSSPLHIENWVGAARAVLNRALVDDETRPPKSFHWRIDGLDIARFAPEKYKPTKVQPGPTEAIPKQGGHKHEFWRPRYGELAGGPYQMVPPPMTLTDLSTTPATVWERSSTLLVHQNNGESLHKTGIRTFGFIHWAHPPGIYRVRITASAKPGPGWVGAPTLSIVLQPDGRELGQRALTAKPQTFEFTIWRDSWKDFYASLNQRGWGMLMHVPMTRAPVVRKQPRIASGAQIESIEIQGPLAEVWPPPSHRAIVGDPQQRLGPRAAIARFAERAWRRPLRPNELDPLLALYESGKGEGHIAGLRLALTAVLASPHFIFLEEGLGRAAGPGVLSPYELASRLSYFLWSTLPDGELLAQAASGKLSEPAVLAAQTRRMIADQRSRGFVTDFTGQWLRLRDLAELAADETLFPEFDDVLKTAMVGESQAFIAEMLRGKHNLSDFLASDWGMLNECMARHYGIPGVVGAEFRKVALKPEWQRGGVLTQASVLTVTANGIRTLPVHRGIFVLDEIFNDPPPPPPPGAGQLEDTAPAKAGSSVRERLQAHRSAESCMSCHRRIDPYGFALEAYDPVGKLRTHELDVVEKPGRPDKHGNRTTVRTAVAGDAIETSAQLTDGRSFKDLRGLSAFLLADGDRFREALAAKLLTYGRGRACTFADRPALAAIRQQAKADGDHLEALIVALVTSPAFRNR